jgi:exodeoxyribonuclease VII large subunit
LKANTHAHFRRFAGLGSRLTMRVLHAQLAHARQRLLVSGERMTHSARTLLRNRADRFAGLAIRFKASKLSNAQAQRQVIARDRERMLRLSERARRALATSTQRLSARVAHSGQLLNALSYRGVLTRGFALVRNDAGHPMHTASEIGAGARMSIEFADGRVSVIADGERTEAAATPKPVAREAKPATPKRDVKKIDQGSLF